MFYNSQVWLNSWWEYEGGETQQVGMFKNEYPFNYLFVKFSRHSGGFLQSTLWPKGRQVFFYRHSLSTQKLRIFRASKQVP